MRHAILHEVFHPKMRRYNAHKQQQLCHCQEGDPQGKHGRLFDAPKIDQGKNEVTANRSVQHIEARVQKMQVTAQCIGNGGRGK